MKKFKLDMSEIKPQDFENKFREWWGLVMENYIQHSPGDFNCLEEIDFFLEDPDQCLLDQRKFKNEMDEEMQKSMEKDLAEIEKNTGNKNPTSKEMDEYFTNCFGMRMKRSKK